MDTEKHWTASHCKSVFIDIFAFFGENGRGCKHDYEPSSDVVILLITMTAG